MLTGQILLQLLVILLVVQLFGYLMRKIGQQWVIGEILAGLALGPSLLGLIWPGVENSLFPSGTLPTLEALGNLGLILYMFSLGSRLDIQLMLRQGQKASVISLSGILLPFALGLGLGIIFFHSLAGPNATLFSFMITVGTAMAITAFPVLARLLAERKMLGTRVGMITLTSASVGDVIAWCLLAFVVASIHANGPLAIAAIFGETFLFIGVMLLLVRPLFHRVIQRVNSSQIQLAFSLAILLAATYTTNQIGIHPVFGAFLTGLILPRNLTFTSQVRSLDKINNMLFLPLFFVYSGLNTRFGLINGPTLWLICLLMLSAANLGKLSGGIFSMRLMRESWKDALTVGVLMNTRGLVELIVLNIGLQFGVLSPTLFSMLVIMALVTTMIASPVLYLLGYRTISTQSELSEDEIAVAAASGQTSEHA